MTTKIYDSPWPIDTREIEFCPLCGFRWIAPIQQIYALGVHHARWECSSCNLQLLRAKHTMGAVYQTLPMYLYPAIDEVILTGKWNI